jgi:hypothetical protein
VFDGVEVTWKKEEDDGFLDGMYPHTQEFLLPLVLT